MILIPSILIIIGNKIYENNYVEKIEDKKNNNKDLSNNRISILHNFAL